VRLLFCLFADFTGIFERGIFQDYIEQKTNDDGSDLAFHISAIFEILNKPREERLSNIDEDLNAFPFVNGKLFKENLSMAAFDSKMRKTLLECCILDWSKISPAIFGSLFQSVMYEEERRHLGAHYTSEKNILKLIRPLFLDELWEEFEKVKSNSKKLIEFHNKIARLLFLDPACGCGNFLIITYRELRLLEIEIIKKLFKGQQVTEISNLIKIDIDHFYGIEIEEFPAQISQVAMWLIEHQMNMIVSDEFGEYFIRLPLLKSANIINNDALKIKWSELIEKNAIVNSNNYCFDYIFGNPPYSGSKLMSEKQRCDIKELFNGVDNSGVLDYVSGWYMKATKYIQNKSTKVGFVSTNSINQGEQVGPIWNTMFNKYKIKIHFAHQTFKWSNEARGIAAVYCVIIGFANYDNNNKQLFEYDTVKSEPHVRKVKNINPYLVDGSDFALLKRSNPLCDVPKMSFGNMPLDGGNLLLTDSEKIELLKKEPKAERFIKPLISAKEYLRNAKRWCIWLVDAQPKEIKSIPEFINRIKKVKAFRLNSVAPSTRNHASTPSLFRDRNNPETYILIPSTTSEKRNYIPMGFFTKEHIANNSCHIIPNGSLYQFGILISDMHMSWIKYTCGKLEGRYRYSKDIVYNNYPFPENPSDEKVKRVELKAQKVLDIRKEYPDSSLADLYDPNSMPPKLVKAHHELDKAVDRCYRPQPFTSDTNRLEFLFELYNKYTSPLISINKIKSKRKRKG
ncbi:MAG: class I SAM-dependent DNA methyltransferase, partial [Bacteroidetes bacterium]|nr:class I SAM-dependent DNA methyltransferase [Bacteroidota bacterium]